MRRRPRPYHDLQAPYGTPLDAASIVQQYGSLVYLMNEGAGVSLNDASIGEFTGTFTNNGTGSPSNWPQWVLGRFGWALNFNGNTVGGSKVTFNSGLASIIGTTGTILAWLYPTAATNNFGSIITQNAASGLFWRSTQKLDWFQGSSHLSAGTLPLNKWSHIAVTLANGSGVFYINGIQDSTFSVTANPVNFNTIGNDPSNEAYAGQISGLSVLNKIALPAAWIQLLYSDPQFFMESMRALRWLAPTTTAFSFAPSGGLVFGGSASPNVTFSPVASGGLTLGGAASPSASFNPPASGGLVLGGSATPALTFTATASGGVIFGGSATPNSSSSFSYTASGGIKLGGSASPGVTFAPVASGGLTLGGSASPGVTFSPIASGGIVLGGTATVSSTGAPASLLGAIETYWTGAGLISTVGPLFTQITKENKPPYAVQTVIAGPKRFWNFTKSYYEWVWVQVAVFGTGEADVRQRAEVARDTLDLVMDTPSLLVISPGTVTGCWGEEGVRTGKPPGTNVPGGATYMATMKYRFQVYRTRP
jgi:hypothetical protein